MHYKFGVCGNFHSSKHRPCHVRAIGYSPQVCGCEADAVLHIQTLTGMHQGQNNVWLCITKSEWLALRARMDTVFHVGVNTRGNFPRKKV